MNILDKLNDCQQKAVTYSSDSLIVLAGAGSGKTRVLIHRIIWLMQEQGLQPHNIMAVTFTNKAAKELKSRIEYMLKDHTSSMFVGTFHSLAHRLLRIHWQESKLPENFQVIDSEDQLRLIKRIIKEMSIDDTRWPPKQVQGFINQCKDQGLRSQDTAGRDDYFFRNLHNIYVNYEQSCTRGGIVDFGELLLRAYELWRDNPELLKHYQRRFSHVLVDEFQDTNDIQYMWLKILSQKSDMAITVVGDDDQSIYGWRGAKIENIQYFSKDYPDSNIIRLEQNYRSTNTILKAANAVIAHNSGRLGKNLWTDMGNGNTIKIYCAYNDLEEARYIVDSICNHHNSGSNYQDIAILYRSNAQSRSLEEQLLQMQVPYRIYGGLRFYERLEIKNATAYLRMLVNPSDDTAFERVINLPPRGIGEQSLAIVRDHARATQVSLWQALADLLEHNQLPSRIHHAFENFVSLIDRLQQKTQDMPLEQQVETLVKESGLYDHHGKEKGKQGEGRLENLQELFRASGQFADQNEPENALVAFLDHASLEAGEGQAKEHTDCVQLMTLHSAKGLEFPLVFITGMEDGLFPHRMSMDDPVKLEEERRLCYVGITRAMNQLYITYAQSRRMHGYQTNNRISRFLNEIPEECTEEVRIQSAFRRPLTVSDDRNNDYQKRRKSIEKITGGGSFGIGTKVSHPLFGSGIIVNREGDGDSTKVQVKFHSQGTKWLVLTYAKLQAIEN